MVISVLIGMTRPASWEAQMATWGLKFYITQISSLFWLIPYISFLSDDPSLTWKLPLVLYPLIVSESLEHVF